MRIEGEKILCIFKKMSGPYVIAGTGRHREQRAIIEGLPAVCIVTLERNGDVEGKIKENVIHEKQNHMHRWFRVCWFAFSKGVLQAPESIRL